MKIRTQIVTTLVPVVIATLGLVGFISYQFLRDSVEQTIVLSLQGALERGISELSAYVEFAQINADSLRKDYTFIQYQSAPPGRVRTELLEPRLLTTMRDTIESFAGLSIIELYASSTQLELALGLDRGPFSAVDPEIMSMVAEAAAMEVPLLRRVRFGPKGPELILLYSLPPLGGPTAKPAASAAFLVLVHQLDNAVPSIAAMANRYHARLLVHRATDRGLVYDSAAGSLEAIPIQAIIAADGDRQLHELDDPTQRLINARIDNVLISMVVPTEILSQSWQPMRDINFRILLIAMIGGAMLVAFVAQVAFVRPIERLAREFRRRADGDALELSNYSRTDEIHELAESFEAVLRNADEARRQAIELASLDTLTGLANRRMFQQLCARFIASARRHGERVALFFIDLDNFKFINDHYGHAVGDQLLVTFSDRLRGVTRDSDLLMHGERENSGNTTGIARIAGDEFAILLNLVDSSDATIIARRILDSSAQPCMIEGKALKVLASIGIAMYPDDANDAEQLYQHADAAMFQAKLQGKQNFYFFSEQLAQRIRRKQEIQEALRTSIERDEFHVLCQPYVEADSYCLAGGEVLIRWTHPELGRVSPDEFITVAESTGIIRDIDLWVVEQACKRLAAWQREGITAVPLSINISAAELRNESFPQQLADIVKKHEVASHWLELELTETKLVDADQRSMAILTSLRELGMGLALDDFGKGFTSLNQLKLYPVNKIKIDRSFITEIGEHDERLMIADVIMQLGSSYRLRTTAEGIENATQAEYMARAGCDYLQGYLFSKPLPMEEFGELLRGGNLEMKPRAS